MGDDKPFCFQLVWFCSLVRRLFFGEFDNWELVVVLTAMLALDANSRRVDRLWSLLPTVYGLHYLAFASVHGLVSPRLLVMTGLQVVWSLRLSYNYWRKGGYTRCLGFPLPRLTVKRIGRLSMGLRSQAGARDGTDSIATVFGTNHFQYYLYQSHSERLTVSYDCPVFLFSIDATDLAAITWLC
jgi:Protein of unknown function (DUF1295)